MKISLNWLKQYIDLPESPEEISDVLTATGLEVEKLEKIEALPNGLKGVVVGEVLTCVKHPGADKLKLTTVDIGADEPSQIVCGAPNVAEGQKVLVATVGTTLYPTGGEAFKIKRAKIRGEESMGMICAVDELGLGTDHSGILVLDTDLPNGSAGSEYFDKEDDYSIEIGLTPNRGDATGHIGVARDLKAYYGREINWPSIDSFKEGNSRVTEVVVEDTEGSPRYSGVTITDINVGESPDWLKDRLLSIGLNPINNVVDVTNFVLHETGQPLHAFDADEITGNKVVVKKMPAGTSFKTLDEIGRKLTADDLMICNEVDGMCIAGVFGGIHSGVKDTTSAIFLESAYFSPATIRKTAQHHQLKTDASFRFERGADPELTVYALKRAANLICEIAGGKVSSPVVDIYPEKIPGSEIKVSFAHIKRLIGIEIPQERIIEILNNLDIQTENVTADGFTANVPAYRSDVTREADVIEEILRIYGFNQIPLPETVGSDFMAEFPLNDPEITKKVISDMLTSNGFYETMTNSLTKPIYSEKDSELNSDIDVHILNKLSEDLGVMRQRMLYNLMEAASYNINHKQRNLKFFEFGKTYTKGEDYQERKWLALLITGKSIAQSWNSQEMDATFYDLSGVLQKLFSRVTTQEISTSVVEGGSMDYGLEYTVNGKRLALAGKVSPQLSKLTEVKQEVFYSEIDWDYLSELSTLELSYVEVPKYPEVKRDLSLVLKKNVSFDQVNKVAAQYSNHLLKKMNVFDVYEGDKVGEDEKAYAISFILQDPNKTLTDKIIDKTMSKLMGAFEKELKAVIRK